MTPGDSRFVRRADRPRPDGARVPRKRLIGIGDGPSVRAERHAGNTFVALGHIVVDDLVNAENLARLRREEGDRVGGHRQRAAIGIKGNGLDHVPLRDERPDLVAGLN